MFKMGFSKSQLSGGDPVPEGWYYLQFNGFKPKFPRDNKDSVNLNPEFEVVQHAEYSGRKVWPSLNSKGWWVILDFTHSFGERMDEVQDGNQGTEAAELTMPGVFDGSEQHPDNPDLWKYLGPFTNKVIYAEVAIVPKFSGNGNRNDIRQYKCAVTDCEDRHSTNLLKSKG
jgi:hypothetical protein